MNDLEEPGFEGAADSQIPGGLVTSLLASVVETRGRLRGEQACAGRWPGLQAFQPVRFGSRDFFSSSSSNLLTRGQLLFTTKFLQVSILLL